MPTPIGHALAGLAVGLAAEPIRERVALVLRTPFSRYALIGALFGALPDADLLYPPWHRGASHSLGLVALLMIVTAGVTGKVTRRIQWRWVAIVGLAYASHVLLDWLGTDRYVPRGLEVFWPFSRTFYISDWDLFPPTERRIYLPQALAINVRAVATEVVVMAPIAALAWWCTRSRRSRA